MRPVSSAKIDRWLGPEAERLSKAFKGFHGPPIPVASVPGKVYLDGSGEFVGEIFGSRWEAKLTRLVRRSRSMLSAGFASLSDLISEATTGGKSQNLHFYKSPTTATTVGNAFSHFNVGVLPTASGVGGTSGTGRVCTSSTTGALRFTNPTGGDTTHLTTMTAQASVVNSVMLYDRLWDMSYNHATATSTAVDANNRPTRYQTAALAPGNFLSGEITTALSATAHNLTLTYVDQDGNVAEAAAAYAAPVSAVAGRTPTVAGQWFVPLNSGDTGLRYLTNVAQSTITSVTGVTSWFVGHPLAIIPFPMANVPFILDGINSAFNLTQIYDSACLAFLTPAIATTGNWTFTGNLKIVSG